MQAARFEDKPVATGGGATATQPKKLREKKVRDLITDSKRRLVEVPYTASLADTMNALLANRLVAAPVAAPPGHWIGAGGSMIMESDKQTGAARKQYIGMVTMLDVVAHIAGDHVGVAEGGGDLDQKMQVPVSSIIGQCLESLSLWTLNPNTDITDCMELFSKGIHRALVPIDSHMENIAGAELVELASGYRMVTQMDLLKFLKAHEHELSGLLERPVKELGAVSHIVFGVSDKTTVIDAIKCMNSASLNAVPIVESPEDIEEDHGQLIDGKDRKLVGIFSATDLRGCPIPLLQSSFQMNIMDFINRLSEIPSHESSGLRNSTKELITCHLESRLGEVVDRVVNNHVHRACVVNEPGLLVGLISLTDIIRVTRVWLLSEAPS
ncbi:hypothetical protein OROGR_029002 [Orobanche gracilis]